MKVKATVLSIALAGGVAVGAYAANCTTTISKPDGTRIQIVVEGETCSMDWNSGVCQCT